MEHGGLLNRPQQNRLLQSCRYVDGLLQDIESVLAGVTSKSALPMYNPDFSPAQRKMAEDYIARIRTQLIWALSSQEVRLRPPRIGAIHSILTSLEYMRGYGTLHPEADSDLNGLFTELQGLAEKFSAELRQTPSGDLQARLGRLREQVGEHITQAFTSHGRLLEAWAARQLFEMRARFDSHAGLCRAQLGQILAGQSASGAGTPQKIRHDLGLLEQWQTRLEGEKLRG